MLSTGHGFNRYQWQNKSRISIWSLHRLREMAERQGRRSFLSLLWKKLVPEAELQLQEINHNIGKFEVVDPGSNKRWSGYE